ncbi:MAG: phosphatidylglycerophosphatase A [Candidatus Lightella neohaematopini]|nr:phosphatidylglycerophosphatase A [Candidatus Lightella neohaematopini]MCV2528916.1 phosphatidylglycerophosphatase A [Candidatus Lightella neohaematopini]
MNFFNKSLYKLLNLIVTGFGIGYLPCSGTVTTIISSIICYYITLVFNFSILTFIIILILSTLFCHIINDNSDIKDNNCIILDEFIGTWIVILLLPNKSFLEISLSIFLFRILDIIKPWPLNLLDKIYNGFGIMIDDILAALIAVSIIILLNNFI